MFRRQLSDVHAYESDFSHAYILKHEQAEYKFKPVGGRYIDTFVFPRAPEMFRSLRAIKKWFKDEVNLSVAAVTSIRSNSAA